MVRIAKNEITTIGSGSGTETWHIKNLSVTSLLSPSEVEKGHDFRNSRQDGLKFEVAIYLVYNISLIKCDNTDGKMSKLYDLALTLFITKELSCINKSSQVSFFFQLVIIFSLQFTICLF